jgi:hypothetical protein
MPRPEIERQAKLLARDNRQAEPQIQKIYWFPHEHEVRLVEVLSSIPASGDGRLHPYFFRASAVDNLPAPSGLALIRPDEVDQIELPADWGRWEGKVELDGD